MRRWKRNLHRLVLMTVLLSGSWLAGGGVAAQETTTVTTPTELEGAESHLYREGEPQPMRLFVFKPTDWQPTLPQPAWIHFYGGGFERGTPDKAAGWARSAARRGMIGIAPDYRTRERFGTAPDAAVADARAVLRWVQEHAAELGVDPERIIVSGNSAGGMLALWTAIQATPPGSDPAEAPLNPPAVLILSSPVSNTHPDESRFARRIGAHAAALSPVHQLDAQMPPVLLLHGDADATVPYESAVGLAEKLKSSGNTVTFVTVPGGSHNFRGDLPDWKDKTNELIDQFLMEHQILPVAAYEPAPAEQSDGASGTE